MEPGSARGDTPSTRETAYRPWSSTSRTAVRADPGARALAADCAILDLSLPDASDLQALLSLRSMSEDLPIIVLTGLRRPRRRTLRRCDLGADDYLGQEPGRRLFTSDRAVRYAIARRRLTRDVAAAAAAATIDTASGHLVGGGAGRGKPARTRISRLETRQAAPRRAAREDSRVSAQIGSEATTRCAA